MEQPSFLVAQCVGEVEAWRSREAAIPKMDVLWKQDANDPERRPVPAYEKEGYEKRNRGTLLPGAGGYSGFRNSIQKPLTVMMVVVALVLLIACANMANLLLARAAARQREMAIRLAVGAGHGGLIAQLVVETLVVSLAGGLLGLLVASWGVQVLLALMPARAPTGGERIARFAVARILVCRLYRGGAGLRNRPGTTGHAGRALTSALKNEVATMAHPVRPAASTRRSAGGHVVLSDRRRTVRAKPSESTLARRRLHTQDVLLVNVNPQQSGYKGQRLRDFYQRLLARARTLPGVRSASLAGRTHRWPG